MNLNSKIITINFLFIKIKEKSNKLIIFLSDIIKQAVKNLICFSDNIFKAILDEETPSKYVVIIYTFS